MSSDSEREFFDAEEGNDDDLIEISSNSSTSSIFRVPSRSSSSSARSSSTSSSPITTNNNQEPSSLATQLNHKDNKENRKSPGNSRLSHSKSYSSDSSSEAESHLVDESSGVNDYSSEDVDSDSKLCRSATISEKSNRSDSDKYLSGSEDLSDHHSNSVSDAVDDNISDSQKSSSDVDVPNNQNKDKKPYEFNFLDYEESSEPIKPKAVDPPSDKTVKKKGFSFMIQRMLGITSDRNDNSVHVKAVKKTTMEFSGLSQTQDLKGHVGPIWTMKFSNDGAFLASGGKDAKIRIWSVGIAPDYIISLAQGGSRGVDSAANDIFKAKDLKKCLNAEGNGFKLLLEKPIQILAGHSGDVVDLSWSKSTSKFLLSASVDKTVKLWCVKDKHCLQTFHHNDLVTSVDFHPVQDLLFVTGCMDRTLRIWAVKANVENPQYEVVESAHTPEMITSACFTPDGRMVVAGLCRGLVLFYSYFNEGPLLRFFTQMDCRNRRGEFRFGRNVTGISFFRKKELVQIRSTPILPTSSSISATLNKTLPRIEGSNNHETENLSSSSSVASSVANNSAVPITSNSTSNFIDCGKTEMLVSINDSRIRLCDLDDFSVVCKAKGAQNTSMQIKASFSEDGKYIISGSETGAVFIWNKVSPSAIGGGIAKHGGGNNMSAVATGINSGILPQCSAIPPRIRLFYPNI